MLIVLDMASGETSYEAGSSDVAEGAALPAYQPSAPRVDLGLQEYRPAPAVRPVPPIADVDAFLDAMAGSR